jgi:predicted dehydrogenase
VPSPYPSALRVVVRGSGSIGQRHARVFRQVGAEVALWPVRDRGLGPDAVDEVTGVRLLDDASGPGALRDTLVVVATDTSRHVADALEALDAGAEKVLVEKPVAPTADAARTLHEHHRRSQVWVAAPLRAHEGFRHLRRLVGRLQQGGSAHVWSQSWLPDWRPERDYRESYSARADEGGALRDLIHEVDHATVLFGRPVLLGATVETLGPLEIASDQAATLLWRTDRSFTVTTRLDYVTRPATRGVVVRSPDGVLEWDVPRATVRHTTADGEVTEQVFDHDLDRDIVMGTQARAALDLRPSAPADQRIARGAPATLSDGIDAVRLCDEARTIGTVGAGSATGTVGAGSATDTSDAGTGKVADDAEGHA